MNNHQTSLRDLAQHLKNQGLSPLPVAPIQDPHLYPLKRKIGEEWVIVYEDNGITPKPRFTGKNPSYLDENGKAYTINHKDYQDKQPSKEELNRWFVNLNTGIGCLGSKNVVWIDIDKKNFDSQEECDLAFDSLLETSPILLDAWLENTHGGGYRIGVKVTNPPNFTNFSLTPNGKHIGEALGEGRFTVLAPTIGPSGNPYINLNQPEVLPEVESLEAIGIYPVSAKKSTFSNQQLILEGTATSSSATSSKLGKDGNLKVEVSTTTITRNELEEIGKSPKKKEDEPLLLVNLISEKNLKIYNGQPQSGDKSADLASFLNDCYGWLNWGKSNNVKILDNLNDLALIAGKNLGINDDDRVGRIIESIDIPTVQPSIKYEGGDEACWQKVKKAKSKSSASSKKLGAAFTQIAYEQLYGDLDIICCGDKLYKWVETHYEYLPEPEEIGKIKNFCDNYLVIKDDQPTHPYANPKAVKNVWEWVKMTRPISPERLRTKGINCSNGVLTIEWIDNKPIPKLEPHDPQKHYFVTPPQITYNPDADFTDCDKLLSCLDQPSQEILLRILGASLDLKQVRKLKGRTIKMLFCIGGGSNGKDSLREVLSVIYGGTGMTGKSLDDFTTYDEGRKFVLADLIHSRVNWASESGRTTKLDNSKSLKSFATGDTLECERKFQDSYEYSPEAIGLFNLNETPNIYGTGQAAADRFAPIMFKKTFVTKDKFDPLNPGHVLADSRFKYDPEFVRTKVAPAFLNRMIKGLQDLMEDGIDYSITEEAMSAIREENNHLFEFCADVGLGYGDEKSFTPTKVIFEQLESWYKQENILTENEYGIPKIWSDPIRPSDKYLKNENQIVSRFLSLFPKAKKVRVLKREDGKQKRITGIMGIEFITKNSRINNSDYIPEYTLDPQQEPNSQPEQPPVQAQLQIDNATKLAENQSFINQIEPQPQIDIVVASKSVNKPSSSELTTEAARISKLPIAEFMTFVANIPDAILMAYIYLQLSKSDTQNILPHLLIYYPKTFQKLYSSFAKHFKGMLYAEDFNSRLTPEMIIKLFKEKPPQYAVSIKFLIDSGGDILTDKLQTHIGKEISKDDFNLILSYRS